MYREGDPNVNTQMDSMSYYYYPQSNKLRKVTDQVNSGNYSVDIDNQVATDNYQYDKIGNLIADQAEGISSIKWNVTGKVKEVKGD